MDFLDAVMKPEGFSDMVSQDGKLKTGTSTFIVCLAIKKNIHFKHFKGACAAVLW